MLSLLLATTGCATLPPPPPIVATPTFVPAMFFAGRTEGRGTLRIVATKPRPVAVHGIGRVLRDGSFVLDQTVVERDKPPTSRTWTFRAVGPGRYAGTLSDAAGPVAGDVGGNRLHLHFHMHGGIVADQLLDLAPDGASARNRMTFRKLGIVVATLDETIRREP